MDGGTGALNSMSQIRLLDMEYWDKSVGDSMRLSRKAAVVYGGAVVAPVDELAAEQAMARTRRPSRPDNIWRNISVSALVEELHENFVLQSKQENVESVI